MSIEQNKNLSEFSLIAISYNMFAATLTLNKETNTENFKIEAPVNDKIVLFGQDLDGEFAQFKFYNTTMSGFEQIECAVKMEEQPEVECYNKTLEIPLAGDLLASLGSYVADSTTEKLFWSLDKDAAYLEERNLTIESEIFDG